MFNKKAKYIKELENKISNYVIETEQLRTKIKLIETEKTKSYNDLKSNYSKIVDSNEKLIDWVRKILENFGTVDMTGKTQNISIPIYREYRQNIYKACDEIKTEVTEELIIIPEIHFKNVHGRRYFNG